MLSMRIGIAGGGRGIERCSYLDAAPRGLLLAGDEHAFGDLGEVEGFPAFDPSLAACEGEEPVDEPLLPLTEGEGFLACGAEALGGGVGIGERDLQQRALAGERGSQLVRRVRHEASLGLEGGLEASEQVVEGAPELGELVVGTLKPETTMQVRRGDVASGCVQRSEWTEIQPGELPGEPQPDEHGEHDDDRRADLERRRCRWLSRRLGVPWRSGTGRRRQRARRRQRRPGAPHRAR